MIENECLPQFVCELNNNSNKNNAHIQPIYPKEYCLIHSIV